MDQNIAKAGWLHRESSILHRWKKNWFVLRTNGDLLYFDNPDSPRAVERIVVRAEVTRIKPGFELNNVTVPEGMSKGSLFCLDMRNEELRLCAESSDDMKAWQIAIDEARVMLQAGATAPPPYSSIVTHSAHYPGQVLYNGVQSAQTVYSGQYPRQTTTVYTNTPQTRIYPPGTVISGPNGTTTVVSNPGTNVVYVDGYRHRRRYDGGDLALGVVAGAAVGSMMWGPMLWW